MLLFAQCEGLGFVRAGLGGKIKFSDIYVTVRSDCFSSHPRTGKFFQDVLHV